MTRAHIFFTVASLASCLAFGCGDTSDAPTDQEYNDVANSFGNLVAADGDGGEVTSMHDAMDLSVGIVPFGFSIDVSGEANGNRLGLEYSYSVSCKDAQGSTLAVCNSTTDSAKVSVDWSGQLTIPPTFMAHVDRSGEWRLTDIQSGTVTLNGESTFDFDATFMNDFESREYHFSYSGDYDDVRVQRDPHRVLGGQIRYAISADRRESSVDGGTISASFDIHAVLTFTGDGHATFVLDGTHTYDLDLATGHVSVHAEGG